uniref:ZP domain-containing protein n=1 Tax=Ascaris lumbricoides TaxID=6252 RepID=A0A0M3HEV6_ASCLU
QQVYHKWTCDSETVDTFCAVVHSCFVDDGNGDKVEILNSDGCALDKYLLNNLEYPTDLMAGQEAHVYKYADRSQLFYQCQISITIKEPNSECARPQCSEPQGFGAVRSAVPKSAAALRVLKKRAADFNANTLDVRTDISTVDNIDEVLTSFIMNSYLKAIGSYLFHQNIISLGNFKSSATKNITDRLCTSITADFSESGICMSTVGFATVFALMFALFAAAVIVVTTLSRNPSKA